MTAFGGALTDPTKIMGSRIGAYVVDSLLALALAAAVFFLFGLSHFEQVDAGSPAAARAVCSEINGPATSDPGTGTDSTLDGDDRVCFTSGSTARVASGDDMSAIQVQLYAATIGFGLFNYVILSALAGGTIGKLLFGLRVTTARGERAGFGRNLVRYLLLIVDTACCWLPGLLTAFNTKGHRRVGDLVAGTYVVHRSAEGRLLNIPGHLVVRNRQDPYVEGALAGTGAAARPAIDASDGINAPVFDPTRNTYVRYDQGSGTWFQWDDRSQSWVPAQQ